MREIFSIVVNALDKNVSMNTFLVGFALFYDIFFLEKTRFVFRISTTRFNHFHLFSLRDFSDFVFNYLPFKSPISL